MGHRPITFLRKHDVHNSPLLYVFRIISFFKCLYRIYIQRNDRWIVENPFARNYEPLKNPIKVFIDTHISCSEELYSSEGLLNCVQSQGFGGIIVGSDQVWRQTYSPCITDFFLSFLLQSPRPSFRRIAYAASFGTNECDIDPGLIPVCRKGLQSFDAISVRESSGISILKETFNSEGELVLDPTLLLSAADYESLLNNRVQNCESSGIVSYILDKAEDKKRILNDIQLLHPESKTHVNLTVFNGRKTEENTPTLEEWLLAFRNADYVVTDSFHGCVFSIIFRKPFVVIANPTRGVDRFYTLLDEFGLRDRLVFSYDDFMEHRDSFLSEIDYDQINIRKQQLVAKSLHFLNKSLAQ